MGCSSRSSFFAALSTAALLAGCSGTGGGGTGDPRTEPDADELGNGLRVTELVAPATWINPNDMMSDACANIPPERQAQLTGQVIVAIDEFDETGEGALGNIYVQDVPGKDGPLPFSGLTVFDPAFTPPDLRVFEGDVVDTFGTFTEFLGPSSGRFGLCKTLPELGGTMSFRFENGARTPLVIVPGEGATRFDSIRSYENARQWLGMLVKIENVTLPGEPRISGGRWSSAIDVGGGISQVDVPSVSNELYDVVNEGPEVVEGSSFKSITGVFTYFYGFKIAPRSADDFEL